MTDGESTRGEALFHGIKVISEKSRMAARNRDILFDAAVDLLAPAREPRTAPVLERRGLLDLVELKHFAVEIASELFAAGQDRNLHMGDAKNCHAGTPFRQRKRGR